MDCQSDMSVQFVDGATAPLARLKRSTPGVHCGTEVDVVEVVEVEVVVGMGIVEVDVVDGMTTPYS